MHCAPSRRRRLCRRQSRPRGFSQITTETFSPTAARAVEWTRKHLRDDDIEFLKSLPVKTNIDGKLVAVHGALHLDAGCETVPLDTDARRALSMAALIAHPSRARIAPSATPASLRFTNAATAKPFRCRTTRSSCAATPITSSIPARSASRAAPTRAPPICCSISRSGHSRCSASCTNDRAVRPIAGRASRRAAHFFPARCATPSAGDWRPQAAQTLRADRRPSLQMPAKLASSSRRHSILRGGLLDQKRSGGGEGASPTLKHIRRRPLAQPPPGG